MKISSAAKNGAAVLLTALTLVSVTACGPSDPNVRPTNSQLKDAISLLVKNFVAKHPALVNWKVDAVNQQLSEPLPQGYSTEAGYFLKWSNYIDGGFPQVYVPWDLIGQYPNKFQRNITPYQVTSGTTVPTSVLQSIRKDQLKNMADDPYFAAIVGVRYSKVDSKWIIFTSVPLLPVTDPGYGWATVKNGAWKVVDFGTATVGCGIVPAAVQGEFGYNCPVN